MIILIGATSITLAALQASINAPRDAFRECMRAATTRARDEKVGADAFETYMRTNCSVQIGSLRSALSAFNLKNGMARKAAASDAELTIDDYVSSPVDHYRFMIGGTEPAPASDPPKP